MASLQPVKLNRLARQAECRRRAEFPKRSCGNIRNWPDTGLPASHGNTSSPPEAAFHGLPHAEALNRHPRPWCNAPPVLQLALQQDKRIGGHIGVQQGAVSLVSLAGVER